MAKIFPFLVKIFMAIDLLVHVGDLLLGAGGAQSRDAAAAGANVTIRLAAGGGVPVVSVRHAPTVPLIDVKADYGAVGDGVANDTAALQAAITAGNVAIPPGTYLISSTLRIPANRSIRGLGPSSIIKAAANFGEHPLLRNATTNPAMEGHRDANITIADLALDGNKATNATGTQFSHCIQLQAVVGAWVTRVTCVNPKGDGILLIASAAAPTVRPQRISITDCIVGGAARQGIAVTEGEQILISGNLITGGAMHGIDLEDNSARSTVRDVVIAGNVIVSSGGEATHYGVSISNAAGIFRNISVLDNVVRAQTGGGVGFRGAYGLLVHGNLIDTPTAEGIGAVAGSRVAQHGVVITDNVILQAGKAGIVYNTANPVVITGNRIRSAATFGIVFKDSTGGVVASNQITASGQGIWLTNATNSSVSSNVVTDGSGAGIRLTDTSTDNAIQGNVCADNRSRGISEEGSSDRNTISGNVLRNNAGGSVAKVGAKTVTFQNFGADAPIIAHLSATTTWDPPNVASGAQSTTTITIIGAAPGDEVTVGFSRDLQAMQLTGYVSAPNTVTVVLRNGTAGAIDLASGTLRASVWKH